MSNNSSSKANMVKQEQKTVLLFPLNSPGHINASLGIADILKRDFNCRIVFLILGKMIGSSIEDHGHELIVLEEKVPYEDYEIDDDEEVEFLVDEEAMKLKGKMKKKFEGALKWPQMIRRFSKIFQGDPLEAFVKSVDVMEKSMGGELIQNHEIYSSAIEEISPDLIIVDAYYIPPCVLKSKVPWIRLYSANPLTLIESNLEDGTKPPPMIGLPLYDKETRNRWRQESPPNKWTEMVDQWRQANEQIMKALSSAGGELNKFLVEQDCPLPPPGKQAHDAPYLNVYMYPKAIDYDQDDDLFKGYPKNWLRYDSLMRQQSQAGSPESKSLTKWTKKLSEASRNKEAVVFFSLGSLASGDSVLMKRYVDYLSKDQKRLYVVSKGVNGDKYQLNEGNMIGDNFIPQPFFLEKADLAIVHGGNNSVTECMYHGTPMIVLPVFADQLDNAQRIDDLKLGRRLNVNHCTQEQLLQTIDDILSDKEMIERARLVGQQMRSRDDLQKVTSLIRKLADQGSLSSEEIEEVRKSMS